MNREGLVLLTSDVLMVTNSLPSFITRHVIIASKGLAFISIINGAASFWRGNIYRCSWFAFKDVLFVKNNSDVFPEFRLYSLCQFAWQFFLHRKYNVRSCGKHGTPLHANLCNITFHDKIHVSSQQGGFVRGRPRLYKHGLGELFTIFLGNWF